jgi:SAM-dependent methyltransferase
MSGVYSAQWRETFGDVDAALTEREVDFLVRVLPLPAFRRVLDVPCGDGRHLRALEARGYSVRGIDVDPAIAGEVGDMRDLSALPRDFDALINMWASFGFFDAETNERVLAGFAERLRSGGRLVLDLYDRAFWEAVGEDARDNRGVLDRKRVTDGRFYTELVYPDGHVDRFDWQLYSAEELVALGEQHGLELVLACAGFDEARPARGATPRMQLVFERRV